MLHDNAFLSYVHADDENDTGRILALAQDVSEEFEALTGEAFSIVSDRELLKWGAGWRQEIATAIAVSRFLVCIVSPRFFGSTECRSELEHFVSVAKEFGRSDLVLPILYIETDDLNENSPDAVRALVASLQYVDWRNLRFEDRESGKYRKGVNGLASEIRDRLTSLPDSGEETVLADSKPSTKPSSHNNESNKRPDDSDALGLLDVLAAGESDIELLSGAVDGFASLIAKFGALVSNSSEQINPQLSGKGGAAQLVHQMAQLGKTLEPLAEEFDEAQREFRRIVDASDPVVVALLELSLIEADTAQVRKLAQSVIVMQRESSEAFVLVDVLIAKMRKFESFSKSLRVPLLKIRRAVESFRDVESIFHDWADGARSLTAGLDKNS